MSAFLVDKAHIDALVRAALRNGTRSPVSWFDCDPDGLWDDVPHDDYWRLLAQHRHTVDDHGEADRLGRLLWLENLASIIYRYPDDPNGDRPGPCDLTDEAIAAYTYDARTPYYPPVQILKALACYEYQSCEHPGWKRSEAARFCDALRKAQIDALPGYDAAAWEITPGFQLGARMR